MVVSGSRLGALVALAGVASFASLGGATQPDTPRAGDGSLVLVLDASSSMQEDDAEAERRIDAAKEGLDRVIDGLDPDQRVGVRVFGAGGEAVITCEDSQAVVPIGTDNHDALAAAVDEYAPGGEAPIAYALRQAAGDLGDDGQRSILLFADGEDTCDGDPCQVARDLTASDLGLVVNVVGLNVDGAARDDLRCIARAGHGTYFDARGAGTIAAAVGRLSARAFRPPAVAGTHVTGTPTPPGAPVLSPGNQYTDIVAAADQPRYYMIQRTTPGSSIHIGLTALLAQLQIIPFEEREREDVWADLQVTTRSGELCWGESQSALSEAWQLLTFQINIYDGLENLDQACLDDMELRLSVSLTGDNTVAGTPFELVVTEEPPVEPGAGLPDGAVPLSAQWQPMQVDGVGGGVVGGSSFNDAPELGPGSYTSDLLPGETVVFRVHLDWGQWLQAQADFPPPATGFYAGAYDPGMTGSVMVFSPNRGDVTEGYAIGTDALPVDWLRDDTSSQLASATAQIRWRNREQWNGVMHANVPGDYYVAISATLDSDGDAAVIPFSLTVAVFGPAGADAPAYVSGPTSETTAESQVSPTTVPSTVDVVAEPPGTTVAGPRPDRDSDNKLSPLLLGALGFAGAGLASHGAMRLIRHRSRPADEKADALSGSSGPGPARPGPPQRRSG